MTDEVDGLLERIRHWMNCGREWTDGLAEAWNIMSASLATIERQRAEIERLKLNQRKPSIRDISVSHGLPAGDVKGSEYDCLVETQRPFAEDFGVDPC